MRLALLPLRFIAPFAAQTYLGVSAVVAYGLYTMGATPENSIRLALKWPKLLYPNGNEDFMNEMVLVTGGAGISGDALEETQAEEAVLEHVLNKYKGMYSEQPWFSSAFVFSADVRRKPIILVRVKYLPMSLTWKDPRAEVVHILEEVSEDQALEALVSLEETLESMNVDIEGPGSWCRDVYYRAESGPSLVIVFANHIPEYIQDSIPYAIKGIPVIAKEADVPG
jgi:hypothetical protein